MDIIFEKEKKKIAKENLMIEKENKKVEKEELKSIFSRLRKNDKKQINKEVDTYKSFDNFLEAHEWADPKFKKWISNLKSAEYKAFFVYCQKGHISINNYLKGKSNDCSKEDALKIDIISNALKRSKIPQKLVVYKGCKTEEFEDVLGSPKEELIGKVFTDKAFMSTSMVEKIAKRHDKGIFLEILVDKGAKGAYVGTISEHVEAEILFDKGQELEILDIQEENKTKKIKCKLKNTR